MAPGKQSVLSSAFFKNPKVKTVKKHQKLERQAAGLPTARRTKAKVDKKKAEELQREKVVAEFSAGWRRYLREKGDPDADTIRTDMLYHAFGPSPPDREAEVGENYDSVEFTGYRSDSSV
jgi:hypothetical protein